MSHQSDKEVLSKFGYKILQKIGQGSFSSVYKATKTQSDSTVTYAVKVLKVNERALQEVHTLKLLQSYNVQHIVSYIESYQVSLYIFMVTEFCDAGNLEEFILRKHKLAESLVKVIIHQLTQALHCLIELNICHMDIKPTNVLICSQSRLTFKLSDFGIAAVLTPENLEKHRPNGSTAYMAPEKITGKAYDIRSDLWSLGILMFQCLFGRPSYFHSTLEKVKILMSSEALLKVPTNSHISQTCEDLLSRLLKYDPNKRITFEELEKHDFIDLLNIPNDSNYKKLLDVAAEAVSLDASKQYGAALEKYEAAVEMLQPYLETETNSVQRAKLEATFHQYMQRIDEVTKGLRRKESDELPNCSFEVLQKLALPTPSLRTALEIGIIAEEYVADSNFKVASAKMQEALELLLSSLAQEPVGYRKTLMLFQVQKWMKLAEDLKSLTQD